MTHVKINIKLDNEAMQDGIDVARALDKIVDELEWNYTAQLEPHAGLSKPILDLNGNIVGTWTITEHDN